MKKSIALFFLLLVLFGQAFAQETNMSGAELYRAMNRAMVAQDVATLDRILDDNFTLTHMTGYIQAKAEWLADVASGRMRYFSTDEVSVETTGEQTIGRAVTKAKIWGMDGSWRLQQVITVKDGKIMRSVASSF